jgi:hypothetical protein
MSHTPQEYTVPKTAEAAKEVQDNLEVADQPREDDVKCDNHPQRKARNFTGNGAYSVNLCDECTPSWFKSED